MDGKYVTGGITESKIESSGNERDAQRSQTCR
jgi:hypothetical protein